MGKTDDSQEERLYKQPCFMSPFASVFSSLAVQPTPTCFPPRYTSAVQVPAAYDVPLLLLVYCTTVACAIYMLNSVFFFESRSNARQAVFGFRFSLSSLCSCISSVEFGDFFPRFFFFTSRRMFPPPAGCGSRYYYTILM